VLDIAHVEVLNIVHQNDQDETVTLRVIGNDSEETREHIVAVAYVSLVNCLKTNSGLVFPNWKKTLKTA